MSRSVVDESGLSPTLTSGSSEEISSEASSTHPSNTSYGLSSLESDVEGLADFLKLRPADHVYLAAARSLIASQPVFKKKMTIRVARKMQIVVRSRRGYTQLRRELLRRRTRPAYSLVSSLSTAFNNLSLRPEMPVAGKRNESAV